MTFNIYRWSELPRQSILEGQVHRTALRTDEAMVVFNWFSADATRAEPHTHPFDQLVMIISGRLNLEIDGEVLLLEPGTAVRVPPNLPHTAWPAEKTEVLNIDIFGPIRADYLFLTDHQTDSLDTKYTASGETKSFYAPLPTAGR